MFQLVLRTGFRLLVGSLAVLSLLLVTVLSRSLAGDGSVSVSWGGKYAGFGSNFNRSDVVDIYAVPLRMR
jgi:hypothetical protein